MFIRFNRIITFTLYLCYMKDKKVHISYHKFSSANPEQCSRPDERLQNEEETEGRNFVPPCSFEIENQWLSKIMSYLKGDATEGGFTAEETEMFEHAIMSQAVTPPSGILERLMKSIDKASARIKDARQIVRFAKYNRIVKRNWEHLYPEFDAVGQEAEDLESINNSVSNFILTYQHINNSTENKSFGEQKEYQVQHEDIIAIGEGTEGQVALSQLEQLHYVATIKEIIDFFTHSDRRLAQELLADLKQCPNNRFYKDCLRNLFRELRIWLTRKVKVLRKRSLKLFLIVCVEQRIFWKTDTVFNISGHSFYPLKVIPSDGKDDNDLINDCINFLRQHLLIFKFFSSWNLRKWSYY